MSSNFSWPFISNVTELLSEKATPSSRKLSTINESDVCEPAAPQDNTNTSKKNNLLIPYKHLIGKPTATIRRMAICQMPACHHKNPTTCTCNGQQPPTNGSHYQPQAQCVSCICSLFLVSRLSSFPAEQLSAGVS